MTIYLQISNINDAPTVIRGKMPQKKYVQALEMANIVLKNENRRLVRLVQAFQNKIEHGN